MKNKKLKFTILFGLLSILLLSLSIAYSLNFNNSGLVAPTDFSSYNFTFKDIPMIFSVSLFIIYVFYLVFVIVSLNVRRNLKRLSLNATRKINPKLGFLGFLGFSGFLGFFTYNMDKTIFPFFFFVFFGFFGFFYEGKMSNTFIDERYKENKTKASMIADKSTITIIFISSVFLVQSSRSTDFMLICFIIMLSLSFALNIFLKNYLLYRYDKTEEESE